MLLSEAREKYESDKRIEGYSPHTLRAYRLQATLLIRYFNDIEIGTLTTDQLRCYLSESSEQLKPSSFAHRIRFMKSLFRWSHEEGHFFTKFFIRRTKKAMPCSSIARLVELFYSRYK